MICSCKSCSLSLNGVSSRGELINSPERLLTRGFCVRGADRRTWAFKAIQPLQNHHKPPHNGCMLSYLNQKIVFLCIPRRSSNSEHIRGYRVEEILGNVIFFCLSSKPSRIFFRNIAAIILLSSHTVCSQSTRTCPHKTHQNLTKP